MNYPGGGLLDAYFKGTDMRLQKEKHGSDMESASLERLLRQGQEQRAQEQHPHKLEEMMLGNKSTQLGMDNTKQQMDIRSQEEERKKQLHNIKLAEEQGNQYARIGSEMEMLPPGARMAYLKKNLGGTQSGAELYRNIEEGIAKGQISLDDLPKGLISMQERIARSTREYLQATGVAKIGADQRAETAQRNAEAAMERTRATTESRERTTNAINQIRIENLERQHLQRIERDNNNANNRMRAIERQGEMRIEFEKERAKMDAGGKSDPKSFEAFSVKLEIEARAEEDPNKRKELQTMADDALRRALALRERAQGPSIGQDPNTGRMGIVPPQPVGVPARTGGSSQYRSRYGLE
jgi:hypothetical protein